MSGSIHFEWIEPDINQHRSYASKLYHAKQSVFDLEFLEQFVLYRKCHSYEWNSYECRDYTFIRISGETMFTRSSIWNSNENQRLKYTSHDNTERRHQQNAVLLNTNSLSSSNVKPPSVTAHVRSCELPRFCVVLGRLSHVCVCVSVLFIMQRVVPNCDEIVHQQQQRTHNYLQSFRAIRTTTISTDAHRDWIMD